MKIGWILVSLLIVLFTGCETTDDILDTLDHTVPAVQFNPDTLEVTAGEKVTINALLSDESGIQRAEFTYGNWKLNTIVDLSNEPVQTTYTFTTEITVPEDALKSWEEKEYYNDGTSLVITQTYHKLLLTVWDKNRNLRKGYCYVRVK
ncbi:MAG TPA: hypothetical protein PKN21_05150 [Bacteroidales bacterium]|nr:hypothetical protein [Bacteroidales bacterium]